MHSELTQAAASLAESLQVRACRAVFAESCTGGLVAATLARIPGISEYLCGSAVVYRLDTKHRWLGISHELLTDPGPVSAIVAEAMVLGVLANTPEAKWAASVTGHLGPHAPDGEDGLIFIGIAQRHAPHAGSPQVTVHQHWLGDPPDEDAIHPLSLRERRQVHAATLVMQALDQALARK